VVLVEPDADVVEAEVLLDLARDLSQHVDGILAGNRRARHVVKKRQLPGTPLLFGEQPGIFHSHRNLAGCRHEHVKIALLENVFSFPVHRDHHARRLVPEKDGHCDQASRRMLRNVRDPETRAHPLQIGADDQRLPAVNHIFGERVFQFARPLGAHAVAFHFQFKVDAVPFLERDVEVAGIKNLAQFDLDGAQNFVLVETRTDGLPDLGEQFVLLGAAVGIVGNHIVFERKS